MATSYTLEKELSRKTRIKSMVGEHRKYMQNFMNFVTANELMNLGVSEQAANQAVVAVEWYYVAERIGGWLQHPAFCSTSREACEAWADENYYGHSYAVYSEYEYEVEDRADSPFLGLLRSEVDPQELLPYWTWAVKNVKEGIELLGCLDQAAIYALAEGPDDCPWSEVDQLMSDLIGVHMSRMEPGRVYITDAEDPRFANLSPLERIAVWNGNLQGIPGAAMWEVIDNRVEDL